MICFQTVSNQFQVYEVAIHVDQNATSFKFHHLCLIVYRRQRTLRRWIVGAVTWTWRRPWNVSTTTYHDCDIAGYPCSGGFTSLRYAATDKWTGLNTANSRCSLEHVSCVESRIRSWYFVNHYSIPHYMAVLEMVVCVVRYVEWRMWSTM